MGPKKTSNPDNNPAVRTHLDFSLLVSRIRLEMLLGSYFLNCSGQILPYVREMERLLIWFPFYGIPGNNPCSPITYGEGRLVCVCNSTYCDTMDPVTLLPKGKILVYTSSKDGARLEVGSASFLDHKRTFPENLITEVISGNSDTGWKISKSELELSLYLFIFLYQVQKLRFRFQELSFLIRSSDTVEHSRMLLESIFKTSLRPHKKSLSGKHVVVEKNEGSTHYFFVYFATKNSYLELERNIEKYVWCDGYFGSEPL